MVTKLTPFSVSELLNLKTPRKEWLVEGLLPVGSFALLSAREKSGKGLFCIDLAASIAEGVPFLGQSTKQGNAVYLTAEEPLPELQDRISARLGENQTAPLQIIHLDGTIEGTIDLTKQSDAEVIERFIVENDVHFIVLDVLRELHSAQEDSSTEMTAVMKRLRTIAHNNRCTILVTHHDRKNGGARGSTAITSGVDITIQMCTDSKSPSLKGLISANGRGVSVIEIDIEFGEDARWLGAVSSGHVRHNKPTAEEAIVGKLLSSMMPLSVDELASTTGVKQKTASNTMKKLRDKYPEFLKTSIGTGRGSPMQYQVNLAEVPHIFTRLAI